MNSQFKSKQQMNIDIENNTDIIHTNKLDSKIPDKNIYDSNKFVLKAENNTYQNQETNYVNNLSPQPEG